MLMPPSSSHVVNYNDHLETVCGSCIASQKKNPLASFQPENKLLLNELIHLNPFMKRLTCFNGYVSHCELETF